MPRRGRSARKAPHRAKPRGLMSQARKIYPVVQLVRCDNCGLAIEPDALCGPQCPPVRPE